MTTAHHTATRAQYLAARASTKVRTRSKSPAARHDAARDWLCETFAARSLAPIPAAWREDADAADARRSDRAKARYGLRGALNHRKEMGPEAIRAHLRAQRVLAVGSAWARAGYRTAVITVLFIGEGRHGSAGPDRPGVRVSVSTSWQEYGRQSYPRQAHSAAVTVPADWCWSVERSGLDVVDGLLTLWARQDLEPPCRIGDPTLYEAIWVEQARGHAYRVVTGWIATGLASWDGVSLRAVQAHGATREEALATWYRRCAPPRAKRDADPAGALQRRVLRLRRYWDVPVTLEDSHAAGNCRSGTLDWVSKSLPEAAGTTIKAVLFAALTSGDRVLLAVAACEVAAKRARAATQTTAA